MKIQLNISGWVTGHVRLEILPNSGTNLNLFFPQHPEAWGALPAVPGATEIFWDYLSDEQKEHKRGVELLNEKGIKKDEKNKTLEERITSSH